MRPLLPLLLLLICATPLLVSCDDDDGSELNDAFVWQGERFSFASALINPVDRPNLPGDVFAFDVFLVSNGLTYSEEDGNFRGRGDVIVLEFNSSDSSGVVAGRYTLTEGVSPAEAFTLTENCRALIDFDVASQTGFRSTFLSGEIEVDTEGERVELEFTLLLLNGDEVYGRYDGRLMDLP